MNKNCLEKFNNDFEKVNFKVPRIMIGGTNSGTGKTTITCAILMALKNRGYNVQSYKCGPDYIDPMFHRKILGIPSTNLDLFFSDRETILWIIKNANKQGSNQIAVMEGVMGYYDGIGGITSIASTYDLANATDTPAILLVDGMGKSVSLLAEIKGFIEYKNDSKIKGVIINRISESMYKLLKPIIEEQLGVKALGYFPNMDKISIESRHLGLVTADEISNIDEILDTLAKTAEKTLEIDKICELARTANKLTFRKSENVIELEKLEELINSGNVSKNKIRVAVAKDKAFCFYYDENLKILEKLGCQLVEFSPLEDHCLPENICGIIIGGGYPELYANKLSVNCSMRNDIKMALDKGMPCIAECGGFMYLHESILDRENKVYDMVGAIDGKCYPLEKMNRFGYIDLRFNGDNFLGKKGDLVKGHEFHYWESENPGNMLNGKKTLGKKNWDCVVVKKNIFAGFPHLYFLSNLDIPMRFIKECEKYFLLSKGL